ncbi:hypothetical protein L917_21428 [Phytophthora nicotianae]|uniref:Uncharacterized protein n=3 Tax=Phytophthora nicotianae TaxID=4792 RepID=V9DUM3_PHYNI|nr:hypothetical protein F443_22317 [Phytophthora nicotianae P1569]ETL77631.1 hypothetical protein L917_21428 [Phytophthora nicotianae]ETM30883.1 hypothetical protein L914_21440 [Phytophthora nicotianae]ETO59321.1 hypothetical protein F444_22309 [Phytophthora nicotianae P1976]
MVITTSRVQRRRFFSSFPSKIFMLTKSGFGLAHPSRTDAAAVAAFIFLRPGGHRLWTSRRKMGHALRAKQSFTVDTSGAVFCWEV